MVFMHINYQNELERRNLTDIVFFIECVNIANPAT